MKLRHFLPVLLTVSLVLSSVTVWYSWRLNRQSDQVKAAEEHRYASYRLAEELRRSSDDLTRFARMFVKTGRTEFRDYYHQTLAIRNGELGRPQDYDEIYWDFVAAGRRPAPAQQSDNEKLSLQERMRREGFFPNEFELLRRAQDRSDALTTLEVRAFNAMIDRFADESGEFTVTGDPDPALAQSLLHGSAYLNAKADIMEPIATFQGEVERRTREALDSVRTEAQSLLAGTIVSSAGLFAALFATSLLVHFKVITRVGILAQAASAITDGDLRVRSSIKGNDELGILGLTFDRMVERLANDLEIVTKAKERMEKELNVARDIQQSMLPLTFPPYPQRDDLELFATLQPAREVGGDLYDFFLDGDDRLWICVGDVSDKGVPAALFMAVTKTLIDAGARGHENPGDVLTTVNMQLQSNNDACMFVTLLLGVLDLKSGSLRFTNAGHNPPYVRHRDGNLEQLDKRHGPMIGVVDDYEYSYSETQLHTGDQLFIYTDGVTEAMNESQELFGDERLRAAIASSTPGSSQASVETIIGAIREFEGQAAQSDDVTILVIERTESPG